MKEKWEMVLSSYAIIYPWTMMIKSFHTLIADIAMTTSRWPDNLTELTKSCGIKLLHQIHKIKILRFSIHSYEIFIRRLCR